MTIKDQLEYLVIDFENWVRSNYTPIEIQNHTVDEASYPKWHEVESLFVYLIVHSEIKNLDVNDQRNLFYLISRSMDFGRMIAYISDGPQLSNLADLSRDDFLLLAAALSKIEGAEFAYAKAQFAWVFPKLGKLTDDIQYILRLFYNDPHEYCKRQSLIALGKLEYARMKELIELSWNANDEEHHKMACIAILHENIKDLDLLKKYLERAKKEKGVYLASFIAKVQADITSGDNPPA